eukprot:COSAG02_NODE_482_length_21409_cov_126.131018_21_plen_273_part_00
MLCSKGVDKRSADRWIGKAQVIVPDVIHHNLRPAIHQGGTRSYRSTGANLIVDQLAVAGRGIHPRLAWHPSKDSIVAGRPRDRPTDEENERQAANIPTDQQREERPERERACPPRQTKARELLTWAHMMNVQYSLLSLEMNQMLTWTMCGGGFERAAAPSTRSDTAARTIGPKGTDRPIPSGRCTGCPPSCASRSRDRYRRPRARSLADKPETVAYTGVYIQTVHVYRYSILSVQTRARDTVQLQLQLLHVQTVLPFKQRVLETATRPFPLV